MKLNKQDLIKIVGTMQYQSDMLLSAQHRIMELEQDIFHHKWRTRYVIRRLKQIAKHYGEPDIAVSEEELDDQIKSKEN
tara:strand:- start:575 stop:811 length:237 start_codon:yes stop_codon:yes gene_type:complete